jgi:hypothetical protein
VIAAATDSLERRFWAKVQVGASDECWEWTANRMPSGYGHFRIGDRQRRAHRVAWELDNGAIPDGLCVLHHCDNPGCVNTRHLYVGDQKQNAHDRDSRGRRRAPAGELNGNAKLTPQQIGEIRERASHGFRRGERATLAKHYGVTGMTIYHIAKGKTWKGSEVGLG